MAKVLAIQVRPAQLWKKHTLEVAKSVTKHHRPLARQFSMLVSLTRTAPLPPLACLVCRCFGCLLSIWKVAVSERENAASCGLEFGLCSTVWLHPLSWVALGADPLSLLLSR